MSRKLMIQGTMSSAGKSLITAGILRVLAQDGAHAAPFKSQNMALNSFVTNEGREIGRAQAMQAEAAGVEPETAMNPILLKPDSDTGSQVIVNGRVYADMTAKEYFAHKKKLIPQILEAFHSLEERYDTIVIEGAGSPVEINLKQDDIVNMGLAELVDAPVLLVADIDRGGVFAQIYGTAMLLEPEERARIKGIIINKFRGDKALLEPGIRQIEELCGIPVVGVMPYLKIDIDDEDSVSERLGSHRFSESGMSAGEKADGTGRRLRIAVIRLPHISNYTDFAPLENEQGVELIYTDSAGETEKADLIIVPGSKNTLGDLKWLKERGLDAVIRRQAEKHIRIVGICGGYQMLGEKITDESGTTVEGLRLLPVETEFCEEKALKRVSGEILKLSGTWGALNGQRIEGYEIHMGRTVLTEAGSSKGQNTLAKEESAVSFAELTDQDGAQYADGYVNGKVLGSYVHGLFDADVFRKSFTELLRRECGSQNVSIAAEAQESQAGQEYEEDAASERAAYRNSQYDLLADAIRTNIDMDAVRAVM